MIQSVFIITKYDIKKNQLSRIVSELQFMGYRILNDNRCLDLTNLRCADKVLVMPEFKYDYRLYNLFMEACRMEKTLISKVNLTKHRIR